MLRLLPNSGSLGQNKTKQICMNGLNLPQFRVRVPFGFSCLEPRLSGNRCSADHSLVIKPETKRWITGSFLSVNLLAFATKL